MKIIPEAHAAITQGDFITGTGTFQVAGSFASIDVFVSTLIGAITAIASLSFLVYFILGGLNWITAAGDQAKVDKAKKQLTDAAIGLVVVVIAYFVVGIVGTVLGLDVLNPRRMLGLP